MTKCKHCGLRIEYLDESVGSKRWYHKHNDSKFCCDIKARPVTNSSKKEESKN